MGFLDGIFGSLFGGDAPSYQQVAPETTMTEAQKQMQTPLINLGKAGYENAMKYLDPEVFKKNQNRFNAAMLAIQNRTPYTPEAINATVNAQTTAQPTTTAQTQTPVSNFVSNSELEKAIALNNFFKSRGDNSFKDMNQGQAAFNALDKYRTDPEFITAQNKLANGQITTDMLDAYRRQKQAADDAALLAKGTVK